MRQKFTLVNTYILVVTFRHYRQHTRYASLLYQIAFFPPTFINIFLPMFDKDDANTGGSINVWWYGMTDEKVVGIVEDAAIAVVVVSLLILFCCVCVLQFEFETYLCLATAIPTGIPPLFINVALVAAKERKTARTVRIKCLLRTD